MTLHRCVIGRLRLFFNVAAVVLAFLIPHVVQAQITLDGSLGPAGSFIGPNFVIPSSLGQTRGGNLFHSFGLFNIFTGQSATFTGPNTINNILGRVTGGQQSTINGLLRSTIPGANLFLLNPAGVIFGPNARLSVGGSFHVSTADYLKFADGAKFHADLARQSSLSTSAVSAFGFLSQSPAGIAVVQSSLRVPEGQALSLVGGDLFVAGDPSLTFSNIPTLSAPRGKINLAAVSVPSELPVNLQDLNVADLRGQKEVNISNFALVDASGNGGGTVVIRGGKFLMDSSFIFSDNLGNINGIGPGIDIQIAGDAFIQNGSFLTTDGIGSGRARDQRIAANSLQVENSLVASRPVGTGAGGNMTLNVGTLTLLNQGVISSESFGPGNSGDILVDANNVTVIGGAQINSGTFASGNGGTTNINTIDKITIDGFGSGIFAISQPGSTGNAGNISVNARNVILNDQSLIFNGSFGAGDGGTIHITASDAISLNASTVDTSVGQGSTGHAGHVLLEARTVSLSGAQVISNTFGSGDGGTVQVTATDTISLDSAGITTTSRRESTGNAGDVVVEARNVSLTGGAQIVSATFGSGNSGSVRVTTAQMVGLDDSDIGTSSQPGITGNAGAVVVEATNVNVTGGAQIVSSTFGSGNSGEIRVTATDTINIIGTGTTGNGIFASNQIGSTGNSGKIEVNAKNVHMTNRGQITSSAFGSGEAGDITVIASDDISIEGAKSGIFSNALGSNSSGGEITVEARNVAVSDRGAISSSTEGAGNGGGVRITANDTVSIDGLESGIFANTRLGSSGDGGNIVIEAKNVIVKNQAQINSSTFNLSGNGGSVMVKAAETVMLDGAGSTNATLIGTGIFATSDATSSGNAGDIAVEARDVFILGRAQISSSTNGSGNGGTVKVTVTDTLNVDATNAVIPVGETFRTSAILAGNQTGSSGAAGDIEISARNVNLTGGGQIASSALGSGNAGNVKVNATEMVSVSGSDASLGSAIQTLTTGAGAGGNIQVQGRQISLRDGGIFSAESSGTGNAGDILIQAKDFLSVNSSVTTETVSADGGNIKLKIASSVELVNSQITAEVGTGSGKGGNINIDPTFVILNNSQISANAFGGPGGNVTIIADVFLASADSSVTASSVLSTPGTVDIQAPITDLSGSLAPLPEAVLQATSILQQSCAARFSGGKLSSLVAGSREGLPFEPGGFLPSPLYRIESQSKPSTSQRGTEPDGLAYASTLLAAANPLLLSNLRCTN